MVYLTPL